MSSFCSHTVYLVRCIGSKHDRLGVSDYFWDSVGRPSTLCLMPEKKSLFAGLWLENLLCKDGKNSLEIYKVGTIERGRDPIYPPPPSFPPPSLLPSPFPPSSSPSHSLGVIRPSLPPHLWRGGISGGKCWEYGEIGLYCIGAGGVGSSKNTEECSPLFSFSESRESFKRQYREIELKDSLARLFEETVSRDCWKR